MINIQEYRKKYADFIQSLEVFDKLKGDILRILTEPNLAKRKDNWDNLVLKIKDLPNFKKIANPYFLGYGNPNKNESKILFVGKELGFDVHERPDLFYQESINNLIQWEKIFDKNDIFRHNPRNPMSNFRGLSQKKGIHTWRNYSKLVALSLGESLEYGNELFKGNKEKSIFDYCFMTEFHYIPAKEKQKEDNCQERIRFIEQEQFFKKFPIVIFTAKRYCEESQLEKIFNCQYKKGEDLFQ